jgi:hypothetical protein
LGLDWGLVALKDLVWAWGLVLGLIWGVRLPQGCNLG